MQTPPILIALERRRKIADTIRACLAPYGLEGEVDEQEFHIRDQFVVETLGNKKRLSRAILNAMFPHEPVPCTLYHYTSFDGLKGITSSGELRLYPIRNRLGQGGELEAFARQHHLQGYLDSTQGDPFFKELSDDLFYAAMTRIPPKDPFLMWGAFAKGTGARLEFRVVPKAAELRLLMKRHRGDIDPTAHDGASAYWPVPLGTDNEVCRLDLLGIHAAPGGTRKDIEDAITGTAFAKVAVTGP